MRRKTRSREAIADSTIGFAVLENSKIRKVEPSAVRPTEAELEAARTGVADENLHFPKNQLTPNMKATLFMPEFGS